MLTVRFFQTFAGAFFFAVISAADGSSAAGQEHHPVEIATQLGHSGGINSVALSPDGAFALSSSMEDGLKLWDVATGNELRTFTGHAYGIGSTAFSPDGRRFVRQRG